MNQEKYMVPSNRQKRKLLEFGIVLNERATQHQATSILNWAIVEPQKAVKGERFRMGTNVVDCIDWDATPMEVWERANPWHPFS